MKNIDKKNKDIQKKSSKENKLDIIDLAISVPIKEKKNFKEYVINPSALSYLCNHLETRKTHLRANRYE